MSRLVVRLPSLERVLDDPGAQGSLLTRMLQRGRVGPSTLAECVGIPNPPAAAVLSHLAVAPSGPVDVPVADAALAAEECSFWLRFDPVVLVPDLTAVWVRATADVDLARPELQALTEELQTMFEAEGIEWRRDLPAPFGLLRVNDCRTRFASLDEIRGRRLDEVMPAGGEAGRWRRLINESQMIFHKFRSLDRPDQQGMGLWFWGGGRHFAAPKLAEPLQIVNPHRDWTVQGLARWLDAEIIDELNPRAVLTRSGTTLLHWAPPVAHGVPELLAELEQRWLTPAWRALRRGQLDALVVCGDRICRRLTRFDSIAFWRRAHPGDGRPSGEPT